MAPHDHYLENVLPVLEQGIEKLESGLIIDYPQKERLQYLYLRLIINIEVRYGTQVPIQQTKYEANLNEAANLQGSKPDNVLENSKMNPNEPTDTCDDRGLRSVDASGELPELKSLSNRAVMLGDEAQCNQYLLHLQEHALDVRKKEETDLQEHNSEVSQGSTISQMHAGQPVGNPDQGLHIFLLSKAEILGMKWLELVERALVKLEMTILGDLKTVLIEYTVMIDQILVWYAKPANGKQILPEQGKVVAINKKLKAIISKLNPRDIKQIFPDTIVVTEEDFLCALLGLKSEVANHLKNMPEEFRQHQPDDYYIKSFIEEKMDYTGNGSECDIKKRCEDCGFTSARAGTLAKRHKKSPLKDHQSLSLWLERYVDDMFRYVVRLDGDSKRYPFKDKVTDKWFDVELTRYVEDDDGCPQQSKFIVHALNSPNHEDQTFLDWNKGQKYWYHGTDHESVINILEEGIQSRRGRAMQDFSDDDGFYLSSNYKEARTWAFSRSRPAVIIFKKSAASQKFKEMNLSSNNETQWAQIVKYNRSGRSRKCWPEKDLRTAFHASDFVLGPRSIDGRKGTPENESYLAWQPSGYQEENQQLCIRSEEMAESFGEVDNIEGVIFY